VREKTGAATWTLRFTIPQGAVILQSSGTPGNTLGAIGDWHINTFNWDIREKTGATTWTVRGNIQGGQGIPGAVGAAGQDGGIFRGISSTASISAAKIMGIENFHRRIGTRVFAMFTFANTAAAPTLNINATGAAGIWYRGRALSDTVPNRMRDHIPANQFVELIWDGTRWQLIESAVEGRVWFGQSTTAVGTAGKTAAITGFTAANLIVGTMVEIEFTNGNSSTTATLNVSGTTPSPLPPLLRTSSQDRPLLVSLRAMYRGFFIWDGTNWRMINPADSVELPSATSTEIFQGTNLSLLTVPGDYHFNWPSSFQDWQPMPVGTPRGYRRRPFTVEVRQTGNSSARAFTVTQRIIGTDGSRWARRVFTATITSNPSSIPSADITEWVRDLPQNTLLWGGRSQSVSVRVPGTHITATGWTQATSVLVSPSATLLVVVKPFGWTISGVRPVIIPVTVPYAQMLVPNHFDFDMDLLHPLQSNQFLSGNLPELGMSVRISPSWDYGRVELSVGSDHGSYSIIEVIAMGKSFSIQ
jgi:hypothetical protein